MRGRYFLSVAVGMCVELKWDGESLEGFKLLRGDQTLRAIEVAARGPGKRRLMKVSQGRVMVAQTRG